MSERFGPERASVFVFSFKEGILSAVAHDLKIKVGEFSIEVEGERAIKASFDASSLSVLCARRGGADDPSALSASDRRTIEKNIAEDVLEARRFPQVRFASSSVVKEGDGHRVRGELSLHGVTRAISFPVRREGDRYVAEVAVHQPDFGIKPYKAMLGTLKVQADVQVRVEIPAGAAS